MTADFYVYVLFRENGIPFYVGKGRKGRWLEHERDAKRGRSYKDNIICKMLAAGIDIPKVKVAEGLTNEQAFAREIALIRAIGRYPHGPLANKTDGGEGIPGLARPPETRAKISKALTGYTCTEDRREKIRTATAEGMKSPTVIAKMRAAKLGRKMDPTQRAKISAALKGRIKSPETCAKLSAAKMGRKHSPETRAKLVASRRAREARRQAAMDRGA